jgi:hypothetical protein
MAGATSQKGHKSRRQAASSLRRPASWATVITVAILDVTGVVFTIAAAVVLALNEEADRKWWWVVGLAAGLAVLTTVFGISIELHRRSFRAEAQRLAEQLEQLADQLERSRGEKERLPEDDETMARAHAYHDAAVASGDLAVADRLRLALGKIPRT